MRAPPSQIKILINSALCSLLAMAVSIGVMHAQVIATNVTKNGPVETNGASSSDGSLAPAIDVQDVPITRVIEVLARQAGINYILDPELCQSFEAFPEPRMTFHLKSISAKNALSQMLSVRKLVLVEDPVTTVARITRTGSLTNVLDGTLLPQNTNSSIYSTNDVFPIVQFFDVPVETALENLIHQGDLNIEIDPRIKAIDMLISIRWEYITAKQAIIAICQNYGFVIATNTSTGTILIKMKERPSLQ